MLKRRYWFEHVRQRVRRYCRICVPCQQAKARHKRPRGLVEQLDIPIRQWQPISMDRTNVPNVKDETGKKFNQVLTVTDRGSKQVILIPCLWKDKAPVVASQFLHEVVCHRGLPSSIVSDRDTKVTSVFWRSLCHLMEVKARMASPFHAQANGAAERTNYTMKQL